MITPTRVLTQSRARTTLGQTLVLQVDPRKVEGATSYPYKKVEVRFGKRVGRVAGPRMGSIAKDLVERARPFVIGGDWDRRVRPFEGLPKYQKVLDLIRNVHCFRESRWYQEMRAELERNGIAVHKNKHDGFRTQYIAATSVAELDQLFEQYFCGLIGSLQRHGYDAERSRDRGLVMITRTGRLLKGRSGRHRFFAAHILGVKPVAVQVECIHRSWLTAHGAGFRGDKLANLNAALQMVEARHS